MSPEGERRDEADGSRDGGSGRDPVLGGPRYIDQWVLELDAAFSALSHRQRRYVVYALVKEPEWTLTDLATKIAAWIDDVDETDVNVRRRERMYVSLYHTHVPKLVEEDVVTFDPEAETVSPASRAEQVAEILEGAGTGHTHGPERPTDPEHDDGSERDAERL